jgi:hypothetical protein
LRIRYVNRRFHFVREWENSQIREHGETAEWRYAAPQLKFA